VSQNNGNGRDHDNIDTPVERPQATLPEHRALVLMLASVISPLYGLANRMTEVLHEARVAKHPFGEHINEQIAEIGTGLKDIGATMERFGGKPR
jgi:hypothetical protein